MKNRFTVPLSLVVFGFVLVFSFTFAKTTTGSGSMMGRPGMPGDFGSGDHKRPEFSGAFLSGDRPPMSGDFGSGNHTKFLTEKTTTTTNMEVTTELTNAVTWMYDNGLTTYSTVSSFKPDNYLTREQASKFFVLFAKNILGKTGTDTSSSSSFSDLSKADKTLQPYIKESNQMGLLKGSNGNFSPLTKLTRAQAIVIIVRSINGSQDETSGKWYSEYYTLANNYGLLDELNFDYSTLDSVTIKRGEVALLLYRLITTGTVQQS